MTEIRRVKSVTKVTDDFYPLDITVDNNEWDVVYSYFNSVMNDTDIANNFTTIVFRMAKNNNINGVELLQSLKGKTGMELTATMAYMLNNDRSNAVLIGVGNVITPNFYAARNIVQ